MYYCDKYKWKEGKLRISGDDAIKLIAETFPFYAYILVIEKSSTVRLFFKEREKISNTSQHHTNGIPDNPGGYTYREGGNYESIDEYVYKAMQFRFFNNPDNAVIIAVAWNEPKIYVTREQDVIYQLRYLIQVI